MNPFAAIEALGGLSLAGIIAGLLFLEEVGVPLPFTPGDLLLAVSGIAIAAGRVNPVLMVGLSLFAVVAGAMTGRELFSRLGWDRLMRIAGRLHATSALTRTGEMIDRSGWRAVFVARLIPGLRVHSTEIAGVRGMPRMRFFAGLLPAAVIYVAAFTGLGAAFGRPILEVIHRVEHEGLLVALALAGLVVALLLLRIPARRALRDAGGWSGLFTVRLSSRAIVLVPAAIGLDFAGHALAVVLHLPLYLDSIGTVLAAVLAGPWIGGSVGFVSELLITNTFDSSSAAYAGVAFAVGFAVGLTSGSGPDLSWQRWAMRWLVAVGVASTLATVLNLVLAGGHPGIPFAESLYTELSQARPFGRQLEHVTVAYLAQAAIEFPDKLVTVLAATAIVAGLPERAGLAGPAEGAALDIGAAFAGVFRSPHWVRKLAIAAVCLLCSWLFLIPFLLFTGYLVAVARAVQQGARALPDWDRPGRKLVDGLGLTAVFLVWTVPADLARAAGAGAFGLPPPLPHVLDLAGTIWIGLVLLIQPPIWAQYLESGVLGALDPRRLLRRCVHHLGLAVVIGTMAWALAGAALLGFLLLIVGAAVTMPYFSVVAARCFGDYARLTAGGGAAGTSAATERRALEHG